MQKLLKNNVCYCIRWIILLVHLRVFGFSPKRRKGNFCCLVTVILAKIYYYNCKSTTSYVNEVIAVAGKKFLCKQ